MERRQFISRAASVVGLLGLGSIVRAGTIAASAAQPDWAALERQCGGRLGVAALDTGSGRQLAWRADERFPLCSTFKFLLAAAVVHREDIGQERADRRLRVTAVGPDDYAPFTRHRVGGTASIDELCGAAVSHSDTGATNMLLPTLGGPAGLVAFLRHAGDTVTSFDGDPHAYDAELPGDTRDTTSPTQMMENLRHILLGEVLSPPSRKRLTDWMLACNTGQDRLRAGLPAGWRIADKTGTGSRGTGTSNDIAIVWPTGRAPWLIASYLTQAHGDDESCHAVLAEVGRRVANTFGA